MIKKHEHQQSNYETRMAKEIRVFSSEKAFDEMPSAFYFWANKYLAPEVNRLFGVSGVVKIYVSLIVEMLQKSKNCSLLSLGCGDANIEIAVTKELIKRGVTEFSIDCLELSPILCEKNVSIAKRLGIESYLSFIQADLNKWSSSNRLQYNFIMANQVLHHVIELEHLFEQVKSSLHCGGTFFVRDVVGRNGHLLWPENRRIINDIWRILPRRFRYNHRSGEIWNSYIEKDFSKDGFEGVRSQDILPLLVGAFRFRRFIAFGGLIERLTGRAFGHNYDINQSEHRLIIDMLWILNRTLIESNTIKPTQLIAELTLEDVHPKIGFGYAPEFCIRDPNGY